MANTTIYTVGHSNHSLEYFWELLQSQSINCLIDVRSTAASTYNPQFNKSSLSNYLKEKGVVYMHFAEEFGARHTNPALLDEEGKVDFEKVQKSYSFKNGVKRLKRGIQKGFIIALMCSESEPFDCHRFSMISVVLEKDGFNVKHIMKDKSLKTNTQLENQMLKKYNKKLPKPSFFEPPISLEKQVQLAYRLRNKDIAYSNSANVSKQVEEL